MKDIILDTLLDSIKLLPFLFLAFLIIELIEHKLNNKKIITKAGKFGPLFGSMLGLLPQCGFSVVATNLYVTRIVSLGTLISIYLSTSDEMLPILISEKADISLIIKILIIKFIVGMLAGFIIDFILRHKKHEKVNCEVCSDEHCHCESNNIFKSALIHTLKILTFILIMSFALNVAFEYVGNKFLAKLFLKESIFGPFISSLIGLIPNCGASVIISELYLSNVITFGSMLAGLLTGSGVALMVLFKTNKNLKENIMILSIIYGIGAIIGIIIDLIGMV